MGSGRIGGGGGRGKLDIELKKSNLVITILSLDFYLIFEMDLDLFLNSQNKFRKVFSYRLYNGKTIKPETFSASFSPSLLKAQQNSAFIE